MRVLTVCKHGHQREPGMQCRACSCAATKRYRDAHRSEASTRKKTWLRTQAGQRYSRDVKRRWRVKQPAMTRFAQNIKRYGLSLDDYERIWNRQLGLCPICLRALNRGKAHVDHDHASGAVRGILCVPCNTALGSLRDSTDALNRAIEYLARSRASGVLA